MNCFCVIQGVKACIGNFATGCPDVTNATIIEAFYPAIKAAKEQYNGILGLHEYSAGKVLSITFNI